MCPLERFAALMAGKRALIVVRSEVMREFGLQNAFVLANGAFVRLARVKAHVVFQVISANERLIALGTFVRPLSVFVFVVFES